MSTIYKYKVYCQTDSKWEHWLLSDTEAAPTTCPTNTGHTIDSSSVSVVEILQDLGKYNTEGVQLTSPAPRLGTSKTIVTCNFCDPCTWYEQSLREEGPDGYGKVMSTIDTYVTYKIDGYTNWIDLTHSRFTGEDLIASNYSVDITVDGYSKTEDTDYTVNYEDGYVVFDPALTALNEVKAKFSYANGSRFTIKPAAGKKLRILYTEAQFSINAKIIDPVTFQVYVYNPNDLPNKIPYGNPDTYKSGYDFANIGNGGAYIPAFAGIDEDIIVVPFQYPVVKDLKDSDGAEIRISIANDTPIDGYFGSLTAYCLSEDE